MAKELQQSKAGAKKVSPWAWIPTLYFAQGIPYVAVMTISVIMYKKLGISNTDIALYTGWLYLPWVIKPFWSPFVDIIRTKRWWTLTMQWIVGIALAAIAFTLPTSMFFSASLAIFWIVGFASATHDIAADGYYMLALTEHEQSLYVGIRSTFYRVATVVGQGVLVVIAGTLEEMTGNIPQAWCYVFMILGGFFLLIALYHSWILPRPKADDHREVAAKDIMRDFFGTFGSFFRKSHILVAIAFMLLYRLPEAQLVKLITPFLLDPEEVGGLGLTTAQVGIVYGTVGIIGLTIGGIIGGIVAAKGGLKKWLKPMAWSMSLTCLTFVYLSFASNHSLLVVNICVFIEQFGYGFGFTAYMLYLIYFSEGQYKTAHYAICTGFMALGMMLPGMAAGWIQEQLGYQNFFLWTMICCVATIGVCYFVKIDPNFGRKIEKKAEAVQTQPVNHQPARRQSARRQPAKTQSATVVTTQSNPAQNRSSANRQKNNSAKKNAQGLRGFKKRHQNHNNTSKGRTNWNNVVKNNPNTANSSHSKDNV